VFIGPLPSNGGPIVERLCHGNVFADSLPSNGSTCHNILTPEPISKTYFINSIHQPVYMRSPLSLLGNGSVKILLRQRKKAINSSHNFLFVSFYVVVSNSDCTASNNELERMWKEAVLF
jgi:hypothetical protein